MFGPSGGGASVAQGVSPTSAIGDAMVGSSPGGNADAMQQAVSAFRSKASEVNDQLQSLAGMSQAAAPVIAQMAELLKAAVVADWKATTQQTASGLAVPNGGVTA